MSFVCWRDLTPWQMVQVGHQPVEGCDCQTCKHYRKQGSPDVPPPAIPPPFDFDNLEPADSEGASDDTSDPSLEDVRSAEESLRGEIGEPNEEG